MATVDWPSDLETVLVSEAPIQEPGLLGWWNCNTVSDYPTAIADYLQGTSTSDAWTGWSASGSSSISVASGDVTLSGNFTKVEMGAGLEVVQTLLQTSTGRILVGTGASTGEGDIYYSDDDGATWTKVEMGAGLEVIYSLLQTSTGRILAGSGSGTGDGDIYYSDDDGATWIPVEMGAGLERIQTFLQTSTGRILAGGGASTGDGDVYYSDDNGATWTPVEMGAGLEIIYSLLQTSTGRILAGSGSGTGDGDIYYSDDDGATWTPVEMGAGLEVIYSLLQTSTGRILAGTGTSTGDGDVYYSDDNGATWTKVEMGAGLEYIYSLLQTSTGRILAGTGNGTGDGDIYYFDPPSMSRTMTLSAGKKYRARIKSSSIYPSQRRLSFSGSSAVGIKWEQVEMGAGLEVIYTLLQTSTGRILAGTGNSSGDGDIYYSDDNGATWTPVEMGSRLEIIYTLLQTATGRILAGVGNNTGDGDIYYSDDDGLTWTEVEMGAGLESVWTLLLTSTGRILAGTGNSAGDGDIYYSDDNGATWTLVEMGAGLEVIQTLLQTSTGRILAGTGSNAGDGDIYYSDDDGLTWTPVEMGAGLEVIQTLIQTSTGRILAGAGSSAGDGDIYYSDDNGATWTSVEMGAGLEVIFSLLQISTGRILAGTGSSTGDGDIYYSDDNGATWIPVEMGAGLEVIFSLLQISTGRILAGTGVTAGDSDIYYSDNGVAFNSSAEYQNVGFYNQLNVPTTLVIRLTNAAPGESYVIDWLYAGDGSYNVNALEDNSLNAEDFNVYGATPVTGISGNGLSFNKLTDYIRSTATLTYIPDVLELDMTFPSGFAQQPTTGTLWNYGLVSGAHILVNRVLSTDSLLVQYWNGAFADSVTIPSVFTVYSTAQMHLHLAINFAVTAKRRGVGNGSTINAKTLEVYVNGSLFYSVALNSPVKPAVGAYLYIGAYQGTSDFLGATIDELHMFDGEKMRTSPMTLYLQPSYYSALPSSPLQDGYSEEETTSLLRTTMDVGPVKTRLRYTAVPTTYKLQYSLSWSQKQILKDFHDRLTSYGSLPFNWINPITGIEYEARFTKPPIYVPNGPEFIATVEQEVLP